MTLRSETYNYTANIVSYNAATKTATLDTPVDISLGYNSQMGTITSTYSIQGNNTSIAKAIRLGTPAKLSTDENGNFFGIFNVPGNRFQTGQRVFRVDNRTTSTDPSSATTYAEATFTASGLATINKQGTGTGTDSSVTRFTPSSQQTFQTINTVSGKTTFDPIAQSFIVSKDNYPNGVFLLSVKLFFKSKPTNNVPVKLFIVPTLNGFPNGDAVDYSTVVLSADNVIAHDNPHYLDSSTYTEFKFSAPVYISSGETYAIVIQSSSSDYKLYYAQQNEMVNPISTAKALPSDDPPTNPTKIGAIPSPGAFFESQNGITWVPDLTKDLMFVIDRAVFDITKTPQINFTVPRTLPRRKMSTNSGDLQYKIDPDLISSETRSASSGLDMRMDAMNLTTTDFVPTKTKINYKYTTTVRDGKVLDGPYNVSPGRFGNPTPENIYFDDGKGPRLLVSNSNTSFILTATLSTQDANVSPILSDDGLSLYDIRYAINNMWISDPVISVVDGGASYNANTISVTISAPDIGSDTAIATANVVGGVVQSINVVNGGSGYIRTPTITITDPTTRTFSTANAVVTISGETSSSGGNGIAKYITKPVTLAAGQDSGDLRVFYTAYRPNGTNVYVYYKIQNKNDTSNFEDLNWQLMSTVSGSNTYSKDRNNLIEFECAPGNFELKTADNSVQYTSAPTDGSSPQTYTSFIKFAIKIVLSSNDSTKVPFLTDMRALALPSGTGI